MQYKLIVVDMDGTLLNSDHEVSKETKETLKMAMENDVKVAIATGRIYPSAKHYAGLLGISTPIISCNGAIVKDGLDDRVIFFDAMRTEDVINIIKICRENHIYFHFYDDDEFCIEQEKYDSPDFQEWVFKDSLEEHMEIIILEDALKYMEEKDRLVLKFTIMDEDEDKLKKVWDEVAQMKTVEMAQSWHNNMEIMNKNVSKGKAIEALGRKYKIKKEEIIAFGDNYNDASMLDYAGTFVAMENAVDYLKERAAHITATNDDNGVAKAIKRYVFKED